MTDDFRTLRRDDLKAYFTTFRAEVPVRIEQLGTLVARTPGFEGWRLDYTDSSLSMVGAWFADELGSRKLPEVSRNELAIVAAAYFGESVRHAVQGVYWSQRLDNKRFADYGHAILMGAGLNAVPLNPLRIMKIWIEQLANGRSSAQRLTELYMFWVNQAKTID